MFSPWTIISFRWSHLFHSKLVHSHYTNSFLFISALSLVEPSSNDFHLTKPEQLLWDVCQLKFNHRHASRTICYAETNLLQFQQRWSTGVNVDFSKQLLKLRFRILVKVCFHRQSSAKEHRIFSHWFSFVYKAQRIIIQFM